MSNEEPNNDASTEQMTAIENAAVGQSEGQDESPRDCFSDAVEFLSELSDAGLGDVDQSLHETVKRLGKLADSVDGSLSDFNDDDPEVLELVEFVIESCETVRQAAVASQSDSIDSDQFELLKEAIALRLESHDIELDDASNIDDTEWDCEDNPPESSVDVVAPSQEEIAAMLSGLGETQQRSASPTPTPTTSVAPTRAVGSSQITPPSIDEIEIDDELREAFMDDATRGLESMEQALLDLETTPGDQGAVTTIGRELHTIKGASASIGMSNLATYIHEVEELIRETQDNGQSITPDLLLTHVDVIAARIHGEELPERSCQPTAAPTASTTDQPTTSGPPERSATLPSSVSQSTIVASPRKKASTGHPDNHADDKTVRVKASQLNRLMDMLSELVMLRNQRDTEISELKAIHDELIYSVSRIRMLSHEGEALLASNHLAAPDLAEEGVSFSHLNEVANDVMESAQRIRDCYRPVADGNQAVSQFIRNFRLELVQLRRTPVSGLFRRLHRAISDASRTERKQVRVELIGENTGIERSLQERIFEPLLHIVRNSVSHGIETPDDRAAAGKSPQGVIKLQAHSGPDLLVIEVTDDGSGLDYDAIRRRGIERGVIESDKSISRAELARLIFHPGFSTRESANQISGRGVGGGTNNTTRSWKCTADAGEETCFT